MPSNDSNSAVTLGLGKAFGLINDDWYEDEAGIIVQDTIRSKVDPGMNIDSDIWRIKPPSVDDFFGTPGSDPSKAWFYEPLYPIQSKLVKAIIGEEPVQWNDLYDEAHAYWGKGSGKDRTIAKLMILVTVKLLCMKNPQKGLDHYLGGGTIGTDSPIDLINVSKDQTQAKVVFFKNFKSIIKRVKNPYTKKNFFEELGMDLREGKDIQTTTVEFPHEITCHSLNSKQYAGEGLTIFFAVADEIGASPYSNIKIQLRSIRETIDSRFPRIGKLILMSFKYAENCSMSLEYKLGKKNPRVYSSKAATWEVNPKKYKRNYHRHYVKNPERAMWTYECRSSHNASGGYITQKYLIPWCFNYDLMKNPFKKNIISTSESILNVRFKDNFLESLSGKNAAIHVDLAKGKLESGGDCSGIAMCHPEEMYPRIHPRSKKLLSHMGFDISNDSKILRKGAVLDFALQLSAKPGMEVQFADIISFILHIKKIGIRIFKVTYDGFSSIGEIQRLINSGINAEELSVDRTTAPYDTLKDSIYMGLMRGYEHKILERELKELYVDEKGGKRKIDHPETSWIRLDEEGYEHGSKDVSDCVAGAAYTCIKEIPINCGIYW